MYLYCCRCPAPRFPHVCPLSPSISAQLQVLGISKALCTVQAVGYPQDLWHKQQTRHLYFFLESSRERYGHSSKSLSISRCIRTMQLSSGNRRPNESSQTFFRKYCSDFLSYITFTIPLMVFVMDFMQRTICRVVV